MRIEFQQPESRWLGNEEDLRRAIEVKLGRVPWEANVDRYALTVSVAAHEPADVVADKIVHAIQAEFAPGWPAWDAVPLDEQGRPKKDFRLGCRPPSFEEEVRKVAVWLDDPDKFFADKGATWCRPHSIYNPKFGHLLDTDYLTWGSDPFRFRGQNVIGGEINYYFIGMYFKALGMSRDTLDTIITTWKYLQYRPQGADEVVRWGLNLHKCKQIARMGWEEYVPITRERSSSSTDVDDLVMPGWEFWIEDGGWNTKMNTVLGVISDYYAEIQPKGKVHYRQPGTGMDRPCRVTGPWYSIRSDGEAVSYCEQHWRWLREQLARRGMRPIAPPRAGS